MRDKLGHWLATLGPFGIFLIAFLDSAFVPMPQGVDALVLAQAMMAPSVAYLAATAATLGSLAGCLVLYAIARRGGRAVLEKKASPDGIEKMRQQVDRFGALLLVVTTMIPLPLPTKMFVLAAGVFQMRLLTFAAAVAFGRGVRYFTEAFVALRYGDQTTAFIKEHYLAGIAIALVLLAFFYAVNRWSVRKVREGS